MHFKPFPSSCTVSFMVMLFRSRANPHFLLENEVNIDIFVYFIVEMFRTSTIIGHRDGQTKFKQEIATQDVCVLQHNGVGSALSDFAQDLLESFTTARTIYTVSNERPILYRECSLTLLVLTKSTEREIFMFLRKMEQNYAAVKSRGKLLAVSNEHSVQSVSKLVLWVAGTRAFSVAVYAISLDMVKLSYAYSLLNYCVVIDKVEPSLEVVEDILWSQKRVNAQGYFLDIPFYYTYPFILIAKKGKLTREPYRNVMILFLAYYNATLSWSWPKSEAEAMYWYKLRQVKFLPEISTEYFQLVPTLSFSGFCFLIPEKPIKAFFNYLLLPFTWSLWVVIAVCLALLILLSWKASCRNFITMAFFGSTIVEHKLNRFDRFCMLFISVMMFLLCESYLAKMMAFMLGTKYERHMETIEELIASEINLCVDPSEAAFFRGINPRFSEKLHLWNTSRDLFPNCSYCHSCDWARYFLASPENLDSETGFNKFYIMNEQLFGNATSHVFSRNDPLIEPFEWFSQQLFNTGIWKFWVDNFWRDITYRPRVDTVAMLSMQDLITLWWILLYGNGLSFTVFMVEHAFKRKIVIKTRVELMIVCLVGKFISVKYR